MYVREGSDAGLLAEPFDQALMRVSSTYNVERSKGILGPVEAITVPASHCDVGLSDTRAGQESLRPVGSAGRPEAPEWTPANGSAADDPLPLACQMRVTPGQGTMLRFAEELLILTIDAENREPVIIPDRTLDCALGRGHADGSGPGEP